MHMLKTDDERTEEFKYDYVYNNISSDKQKLKVEPNKKWVLFYKAMAFLALVVVISSIITYILINGYL